MGLENRRSWQWEPRDHSHLGGHSRPGGGLLLMINFNPCLLPCGISRWRAAKKVHSFLDPSRTLTLKMTDSHIYIVGFPVFNFRFKKKKKRSISMFYRNLKTLVSVCIDFLITLT